MSLLSPEILSKLPMKHKIATLRLLVERGVLPQDNVGLLSFIPNNSHSIEVLELKPSQKWDKCGDSTECYMCNLKRVYWECKEVENAV
jgi:hypothetical protein